MQIDITKLLTNQVTKIDLNEEINIPKELLNNSRIDELKDLKLNAKVFIDEDNEIIIKGNITGTMMLKDDITLEPVSYEFNSEFEENLCNFENILDITDILWQNILVEIPSKVRLTNEDISLSGDGWRVISEDEYNKERNKTNNPFANLDELLNTKEDK